MADLSGNPRAFPRRWQGPAAPLEGVSGLHITDTMHALAYRITKGRAQSHKYPTMLLASPAERRGSADRCQCIYIEDGGRFRVAAAYSGSDTEPPRWLNLQANAVAVVQVMGEAPEPPFLGGPRRAAEPVAAVGSDVSVFHRVSATYAPRDPVVTLTPVTT